VSPVCVNSKWFGNRVEGTFDHWPQLADHPVCVRYDKYEAVLVVGHVNGNEEVTLQHDPFPEDVQQAAAVPHLIESSVHVAHFDEDVVAVVMVVVRLTGLVLLGDESIDESLDGRVGVVGG
jgi:hypothetical protein